jgi:hypothetical protein
MAGEREWETGRVVPTETHTHKHTHWHLPPGYVVTAVGDTLRIEPAASQGVSRLGDIMAGAGPQGGDTGPSFSPDRFGPDNKS